jgi:predicted RNA binding protein YcfA (HicA-like mRNA interferase family)
MRWYGRGDQPRAPHHRSGGDSGVAAGWVYVARQSGSHEILHHDEPGGRVTVPNHPRITLHPKTLGSILDQARLSVQEFQSLL